MILQVFYPKFSLWTKRECGDVGKFCDLQQFYEYTWKLDQH